MIKEKQRVGVHEHYEWVFFVPGPLPAFLLPEQVQVGASGHLIGVYLHLCTQPTVHLERRARSPSLAGKQMEETRRHVTGRWDVIGEFAPFKYLHRMPAVSRAPQTQRLLAGCKPFLRREKKILSAWPTLGMKVFVPILKLLKCYHNAYICIRIECLIVLVQQMKSRR